MLNIEDAYLTDDEIEGIRDNDVWGLRDELIHRTAKTATEKALRLVVDWTALQEPLGESLIALRLASMLEMSDVSTENRSINA